MKKVKDTESFINYCISKFGEDRFDYSRVEYKTAKTEVDIRCIKHDLWFRTQPYSHHSGNGSCPDCRREGLGQYHKLSVEDFINRSNVLHGNKYDYSLITEMRNMHTKVPIRCKEHGIFQQTPTNHLHNGYGCEMCASNARGVKSRLTQDEVIQRFTDKYSDRFDYSKVKYVTIYEPVDIYCKEHNHWFQQKPSDHLKGVGCSFCTNKSKSLSNIGTSRGVKTTEDFIIDAINVHGFVYDYSLVEYAGIKSRLKIVCKLHGVFNQTADKHLQGRGCPVCGKIKASLNNRTAIDEFKQTCTELYNGRYDYSDVEYETLRDKVIITCPVHGKFKQKASDHKNGKGCRKCANAGGYNPEKSGYFYILQVTDDVIKFGITYDVNYRLKVIKDYSIYDIKILNSFFFNDGNIPQNIESQIKRVLKDTSIIPREEMYQGYTETTSIENLNIILEIVDKYKPA